jgi:hypothetical protein
VERVYALMKYYRMLSARDDPRRHRTPHCIPINTSYMGNLEIAYRRSSVHERGRFSEGQHNADVLVRVHDITTMSRLQTNKYMKGRATGTSS